MEQANGMLNESLREVLRSANQYQHNPSPSQLCYLSKQLETLQSACSRPGAVRQLESSDHIGWIECLTFLVDVVREKQSSLELVRPVLKTLRSLAQAETLQKLLYETFNVTPILAGQVVTLSSLTEEEPTLLEALKLLQKLTYGRRVDYHQDNMEHLVKFLIDVVMDGRDSLICPVLGYLANLCRQNVLVQSAIKNLNAGRFKKLLKTLCTYFDNENQMLVIFSLSTFFSLTINENEDGQKAFFDKGNVEHTLQTIFWIIVNGSKTVAWKYAADLLTEMLRHPQMQVCIKRYRHLPKCMTEVLSMLAVGSEEVVTELFRVLLQLCSAPAVRQAVNTVLFSPLSQGQVSAQALLDAVQPQQRPLAARTEPVVCCLHWAARTTKDGGKGAVACAALEFLIDSCQDSLCAAEGAGPVQHLVPAVANLLTRPEHTESTDKVVRLVKLLSVLCSDKESRESAGSLLKLSVVSNLVEKQLSSTYLSYAAASSSVLGESDSKRTTEHCILPILDLGVRLRKFVSGMQEYLIKILHDSRLHDVLALGLTSPDQEYVEIALRLLFVSMGVEEAHPDVVLCSSVACLNNGRRKYQMPAHPRPELSSSFSLGGMYSLDNNKENHRPSPLCCSTPVPHQDSVNAAAGRLGGHLSLNQSAQKEQPEQQSVDSLIERMKSGLETKDSKSAEVIEVFEHHIKTLEIKEEHLNNLLEAKTMALVQADRVIGQLRSREAAHATEMKKLQGILKRSEGKIEQTVSQMNSLRIQSEQQQTQLDKQLEGKAQEIAALNNKCSEWADICGDLQDQISTVVQEKKSLSNMVDNLQNAHEKLKEQYTVSCSQSKQLEEERKTLSKQLKDRDASLQKSTSTLQTLQTKHKATEKERAELEKEKEDMEAYVDKLRDQLSASENSCRLLQQKTTTLEGITEEQGTRLNQQTKRIAEVESELEKHNQIVSFITSMNLNAEGAKPKK